MTVTFNDSGSVELDDSAISVAEVQARQDAMRDLESQQSLENEPIVDFVPETAEEAMLLAEALMRSRE